MFRYDNDFQLGVVFSAKLDFFEPFIGHGYLIPEYVPHALDIGRRVSAGDEARKVLLEFPELVPGEHFAEGVCELLYYCWVSHHGQHGIINYN